MPNNLLSLAEEGGFEPPEQIYFARRFSKPLRESRILANMAGILLISPACEADMRESDNPAVTPKVTQTHTHLYVIESDGGLVKIGRSGNPKRRCAALQAASGLRLRLVRVFAGRGMEERAFHDHLKAHRRSGEWFNDTAAFRADLFELTGKRCGFSHPYVASRGPAPTGPKSTFDGLGAEIAAEQAAQVAERRRRKAARGVPRNANPEIVDS